MNKRQPDVYLKDIFESLQQIEKYVDNVKEEDFYQNSEKQDAVLRRLEIIGEAAKHVSDEIRENYDEVPW